MNGFASIPVVWGDAPLSQQIFWAIGILGLVLILLQAAVGFIFGHHGDLSASDTNSDSHGGFAAYFSLRSISATLLGFGFGGAYFDRIGMALGIATLAGLCLGLMIGAGYVALIGALTRLQSEGASHRLMDAVSHTGKVYLPIPAATAGAGEIQVAFGGRLNNVAAFTEGPTLPVGTHVRVIGLHGERAVLVEKTEDF